MRSTSFSERLNPMTTASHLPSAETRSCLALDPCTLGRPFHLLGDFHAALRRRIGTYLQDSYNHRCGARLIVSDSAIVPHRSGEALAAWHGFGDDQGAIGIRIERGLLLLLLAYHYGDRAERLEADSLPAETRTEQRFAMQTRRALLGELLPLLELDAGALTPQQFDGIGPGSQILSVIVRDESLDVTGRIEFALDDAWLARLFATCVPRRVRDRAPSDDDGALGARIPVALNATIVTRELLLGDVLDLNRGSILPIRLPDAADVDVDGLKVFRAAVVEHGGKICLTAFELVE
ncbi:hypothetical protein DB771_14520 [Burkholderia sp. AU29985]|nr:FliM/FliN family flagellar motor C-terminal domain-containing protein [Burkholderia dolosa]EAY71529.1 Flagellar motor switch protein [Burkholderia dolosa AU0158]PRE51743.1 hypothetical protein C6P87_10125 [Burkholderia sp. AU12872]PUA76144.1 hypothetical protein DB771_14520 [Burkholderia sp. AU29985]AYZ94383.1 FliM/FliN family flagellar motor switch protein [Burkholderia dolosa]MCC5029225.1 FliM/FliN family flagellar motor C-terminal domain-containing protein [Burkholderia dolosa]